MSAIGHTAAECILTLVSNEHIVELFSISKNDINPDSEITIADECNVCVQIRFGAKSLDSSNYNYILD
jgi:hypothetical protein